MNAKDPKSFTISVFPLPGVVLFPGMNLPLFIFENKYKDMISECLKGDKKFGIVFANEKICAEVGTIAEIVDVENLEEGKMNLLTEGRERFKIIDFISEEPYYKATAEYYEDKDEKVTDKLNQTLSEVRILSAKALKIFDKVTDQKLAKNIKLPDDPSELLFLIASNLSCPFETKQTILESRSIRERTKKIQALLKKEIKRLELMLENKKTKDVVEKNGKIHI